MHTVDLIYMYLFVFLSSSIVFFICCLLGLLLFKLVKIKSDTLDIHIADSFWVGYAGFLAILFFINIFYPVKLVFTAPVFIILIVVSIVLNRALIIRYIVNTNVIKYAFYFIALNILAFVYLRANTDVVYSFDTYNYHFYALRLLNEYPAIKGVMNLFRHLASVYSTIYHAGFIKLLSPNNFFDNYLFFASAHTVVLATFITVISFVKANIARNYYSNDLHDKYFINFVVISFLILLIYPLTMPGAWEKSGALFRHFPDITYYLVSYVFILYFCKFLVYTNQANLLMLIFVAVIAVFVKASSIFLVLLIACMSSYIWFTHKQIGSRVYYIYFSIAVILIVPYIFQNVLKSGALLFPVSFTDLSLSWSNVEALERHTAGALSWARSAHAHAPEDYELLYFGWVGSWVKAYSKFLIYNAGLYLLLLSALIVIFIKDKQFYQKTIKFMYVFMIIWLLSTLFWFFTAPDVRFIGIIFLIPVFVMLALIYTYFDKKEILCHCHMIKKSFSIHIGIKAILSIGILFVLFKGAYENERIFSLNRPIPDTDKAFRKEVYHGVDIYLGRWKQGEYASYTKLLPISYNKDYKFIDSKRWYEGFLPINDK